MEQSILSFRRLCLAAALTIGSPALAVDTATAPIAVHPGQSVAQAIQQAALQRIVASARASWQRGHSGQAGQIGTTVPQIVSGSIVSSQLIVGDVRSVPIVKTAYTAGTSGVAFISVTLTSPNGLVSVQPLYSSIAPTTHGTVTFTNPANAPYYSQPGRWTVSGAYITDHAGNYTQYDATQAQALFSPSFATVVNNGLVDTTPPTVSSGKILTPTVSLSSPLPQFSAALTGTDNVSGIYTAFVGIMPPGGTYSYINTVPRAVPTLSGTTLAYSAVPAGSPTGTWTLTFYELCDVANNCFYDSTPTDISALFGATTFTVTN